MQSTRQDFLRAAQDGRADQERKLKEKSMQTLRAFRCKRTAERCLAANRNG